MNTQSNKFVIVFVLTFILITPIFVSAANESPRILPDNPFYFFKIFLEKADLFFTFSSEKKIEKNLNYAQQHLEETKEAGLQKDPKIVGEAITRYEKNVTDAINGAKRLKEKKQSEEILTQISSSTLKQQKTLESVLVKVPDEAKQAIQNAIEVSVKKHEETLKEVENLKNELSKLKEEIKEIKKQIDQPQSEKPKESPPQKTVSKVPENRSYILEQYKLTADGKSCILSKINSLSNEEFLKFQSKIKNYASFLGAESIEANMRQDLGCPRLVSQPLPVQWESIYSWNGTGSKKLGSVAIPSTTWRFSFSWENGAEPDPEYINAWGLWICETEGQYETCSFEIPAFYDSAFFMATKPRENYDGKTVKVEARADNKTSWTVRLEIKK